VVLEEIDDKRPGSEIVERWVNPALQVVESVGRRLEELEEKAGNLVVQARSAKKE